MAERLSPANLGIALLANTVATAAVLIVLIELLGPISGADFNPAVSFMESLQGRLARPVLGAYVFMQVLGAVLGKALAHAMFHLPLLSFGTHIRSGPDIWLGEVVATGGLLITVCWGCCKPAKRFAPLIALWITAAYWFTSSTSFANLAVTLARSMTNSFSGIRPVDVPWFYWLSCWVLGLVLPLHSGLALAVVFNPAAVEARGNC
jgi:glycerol uptake facilitator-like aquaporin